MFGLFVFQKISRACMSNIKKPVVLPELEALINTLRETIELSVTLANAPDKLNLVKADLEKLNQSLCEISGNSALERHYQYHGNANHVLPYSPATGYMNPIAPNIEIFEHHGKVIGQVTFNKTYEGPPQSVHGSIVASVYDQVLAITNIANGTAGPTANLSVNYRKPTPLYRPLRFEAWVEKVEGKKVFLKGECYDQENLITDCTGLFIRVQNPRQYSD